jgi:hypothetical protein
MTNVTQGPSPDRFTKTGGTNSTWDSQVYSQQGYVRGVFVTSKISSTSGYAMIGLNTDPAADSSFSSIDYAFYFNSGTVSIYESGGAIGSYGSYTTDSIAYVTYDGYNVRYYLDGTLLRTVARSIGSPLHLDSSIYNTNLAFVNVGFGPMGESGTSGTSGTGFNTVSNPANNRVLTSDGTTNAAVAETNLTFDGTILNITRTSGNGSLYGTGDLVLETDSNFYIGAYTARPLSINSANGATGTVYVDSAGKTGFGTTSPSSKVEIKSSVATNLGGILLRAVGSTNIISTLYENSSNGGTLDLYSANVVTVRASANSDSYFNGGNLGIGNTSPANPLDVVGTIRTVKNTTFSTEDGPLMATSATTPAKKISVGYDNTNDLGYISALHSGVAWKNLVLQGGGGNVGIGTVTPGQKLDLQGNGVRLRLSTGSDPSTYYFDIESNYDSANTINFYGTAGSNLLKYIYNTNALSLQPAGGNVGIGTTTPGQKLDVNGRIRLGSNAQTEIYSSSNRVVFRGEDTDNVAQFASYGLFLPNASQAYNLYLAGSAQLGYTDTNAKLDIAGGSSGAIVYVRLNSNGDSYFNGGNLGIGTTSPQKPLDVLSNASDFVSVGANNIAVGEWTGIHFGYRENNNLYRKSAIVFQRTDLTSNDGQGKIHILNGPQGSSGNATLSDARITIAENGNVGIGTTSPTSMLHIVNPAAGSNGLIFQKWSYVASAPDVYNLTLKQTVSENVVRYNFSMINNSTAYNDVLVLDRGNVGIGTTDPVQKLSVEGSITMNYANAANNYYLYLNRKTGQDGGILFQRDNSNDWQQNLDGSGNLYFYSYGIASNAVTLQKSTGNVGIGFTSPNTTLDVQGGINSRNSRVSATQKFPIGHYTPGETVFELDPIWSQAQMQDYMGTTAATWVQDSTAPGGYCIQIDGAVNVASIVYSSGFPLIPTDTGSADWYYMECWIKNEAGSSNSHYMGGVDFNHDFSSLGGNPGSYTYNVMSNLDPGTEWIKVYGYWNGFGNSFQSSGTGNTNNWKVGTKYFTPQALFNYANNSGTRRCYISGWKLIRVSQQGNRYFQNDLLVSGNVGIKTTSPLYPLHVNGKIYSSGDIQGLGTGYFGGDVIAYYSDQRLKTNIRPIESALDKISRLGGYYYEPNELALQLKAATDPKQKLGLLAQEIQKEFPEAIERAPFDMDDNGGSKSGEDYLTVKYERLVPVLLQAIKELHELIKNK